MNNSDDSNTIRILLTTDNHVGYNEEDPITGKDAIISFHEVMKIAKEKDVDMILQTGDLFHTHNPSKESLYSVIRSIRSNCLGNKPCELEPLGVDQLTNIPDVIEENFNHFNYEDPNINVSIPFFTISGNHDDASGSLQLSPLDVLQSAGLVNHFGRVTQVDNIHVKPLLLQKGSTKLALYGLASVREERLFRTFKQNNVKFPRPRQFKDEWFNLLCVHQNHAAHSPTAHLPEKVLPSFMDLIVWGHEHECKIDLVTNNERGFKVCQPGSSVATSLSESESVAKHVGILTIKGKQCSMEKIPLKSVRPMVFSTISLRDSGIRPGPTTKEQVSDYLTERVEELIRLGRSKWIMSQDNDSISLDNVEMPLPLIRLRVDYSGGYEVENTTRFSNKFTGRVANPSKVLLTFQKNKRISKIPGAGGNLVNIDKVEVQSIVEEYLKKEDLDLLPENGFIDSINTFVQKDDNKLITGFIENSLHLQVENLLKLGTINRGSNALVSSMRQGKHLVERDLESQSNTPEPQSAKVASGGTKRTRESPRDLFSSKVIDDIPTTLIPKVVSGKRKNNTRAVSTKTSNQAASTFEALSDIDMGDSENESRIGVGFSPVGSVNSAFVLESDNDQIDDGCNNAMNKSRVTKAGITKKSASRVTPVTATTKARLSSKVPSFTPSSVSAKPRLNSPGKASWNNQKKTTVGSSDMHFTNKD
ncbi:DNA repair exonuclease [Nadsonia fulvescens var. elongata DSM 6958]|uniref:Double-strand break repair protein n=1 Tax=Nadsonia fulvescens var. elongata DSM 6958 TaxID=857566 RepID=A0A1E3PLT3_9ASCO|nr:DNA repair exonuclease [Nadsonia fulvescens var. elongata DSM 6958]